MVYFTGDIHGDPWGIIRFCEEQKLTESDIVVILGDVGVNFYMDERDEDSKFLLNYLKPTIFCIHGNHEQRPANIPGYELIDWHGGKVWVQKQFPSLLFAKDGEIFQLGEYRYLVIGGAYSVDKLYRVARNLGWWPDEQPSEEIKAYVEQQIQEKPFDVVLSHTCTTNMNREKCSCHLLIREGWIPVQNSGWIKLRIRFRIRPGFAAIGIQIST